MKMNRWNWKSRTDRPGEAGQTTVFFVLILGIFLLGALCLAFDFSNMWFHRQAAQTAADAACAAGAMDILVDANGAATGHQGFTLGTNYSCTTTSTDSVCTYAAKNGYNSSGTAPGNLVSVSFPTTAANGAPPGVPIPSSGIAGSYPFIRVDIVDSVQTFFLGLLNGSRSKGVRAFSTCGVELAAAPIPLLVLHPTDTKSLTVQGSNNPAPGCDSTAGIKSKVCIWGGPQQSVQVNSSDTNAAYLGGGANIDLNKGGPSNTGSDLGTWGGPTTVPGGFLDGSTGNWLVPNPPISDPFASLAVPAAGTAQAAPNIVGPGVHGCPETTTSCYEYLPGSYAAGICVGKGGCTYKTYTTAIFQGGVYLVNGFSADSLSCLRMSTIDGATPNIGGVMFYFTGGGSVSVNANSGASCPAPFDTFNSLGLYTGMLANGIKCKPGLPPTGSGVPSNLTSVTSLSGNVLLAPCTGTYGDPYEALGQTDPDGEQRGFLMFQDRTTEAANQLWGGGGSMLLAGTMYFHNSTDFSDTFKLDGTTGSSTYVLGDIVADHVTLTGNSQVTMDLNTSVVFNVLKASIFQ